MPTESFVHDALLYAGVDDFVSQVGQFVREGVRAGEPVLVMVETKKIALLREALGTDANAVEFANMEQAGHNPARIIPAWARFAADHAGAPRLRGVGEPIWVERTPEQLVECQRHESLLNLAFLPKPGDAPFWLVCPYDTSRLPDAVIEEAFRSHPTVRAGGRPQTSAQYEDAHGAFGVPLAPVPDHAVRVPLHIDELKETRALIAGVAAEAGLNELRAADFVMAANEVAVNGLRHGAGDAELMLWTAGGTLLCEVRDGGLFDAPLAGRTVPRRDQENGLGLYLANQVCDLVQIRSLDSGTAVRLHMEITPAESGSSHSA